MNLACLSAFDPVGPTTISHSPADYHQTSNYCCILLCTEYVQQSAPISSTR